MNLSRRWQILLSIAAACSIVMLVNGVQAATYYVDQKNSVASDANPGTEDKPWLSLYPSLIVVLQPGDVVVVKEGIYSADTGSNKHRAMINPNGSGTKDKPITFKAVPEFSVTLEGHSELNAPIQILSSNYIRIEGFVISKPGKAGIVVEGVPGKDVIGISISNNMIKDVQNAFAAYDTDGIRVMHANDVLIQNNRIANVSDGAQSENAAGIKLYDVTNVSVRNNDIKSVTTGIYARSNGNNIQISRNTISDSEVGIKISSDDKTRLRHVSISENIFNQTEIAIQLQPHGGTVDVVSLNNNLFRDYSVAALQTTQPGLGKIRVWNNIFDSNDTSPQFIADVFTYDDPPVTITQMDFNQYTREPTIITGLYSTNRRLDSVNNWHSYSELDAHSFVAPARYKNAQGLDFRPSDDSIAKLKGRRDGEHMSAAVNIGAYLNDAAQVGFIRSFSGQKQKTTEEKKPEPAKSKQQKTETATAEAKKTSVQKKGETDKIELAIATPTLIDKPKSKNNKLEWEVKRAIRFGGSCVLESNKIDFFDGHDNTGLTFRIVNDELYLLTKSNIDISFKDIGVQVGDNPFLHADKVVSDQNVVIKNDLPTLITQLRKTKKAKIQLRFWPTYPATQTYAEVVNLGGMVSAYDEYQDCKRGN